MALDAAVPDETKKVPADPVVYRPLSPPLEKELRDFFCVWEERVGLRSNATNVEDSILMCPPDSDATLGEIVKDRASEAVRITSGVLDAGAVGAATLSHSEDVIFVQTAHHVWRNPETLSPQEMIVDNFWAAAARHRKQGEEGRLVDILRRKGDNSWAGGARRARAALQRLAGTGLDVVLWRLYGPACSKDGVVCAMPLDPVIRGAVGTDTEKDRYARVADLTDAAEECREQWALDEGLRREEAAASGLAEAAPWHRRSHEWTFWEAAGEATRLEEKVRRRLANSRCRSRELTRVAQAKLVAWREVMRRCIEAHRYDGEVPARISALASADREATASSALREALRPPPPRLPREERDRLEVARQDLIRRVRRQAQDLIGRASQAYREARELEFAGDTK